MKSNIANKVLELVKDNLERQVNKGVETYGQTLDDCPDDAYDWNDMLTQELIDGLQYALKENSILRKDNRNLRKELIQLRSIIGKR